MNLFERFLALLFPDRCAGCNTLGSLWCERCQASLRPYTDSLEGIPESLDQIYICYLFEGKIRNAIHEMKYHKRKRVAQPLGHLMGQICIERFDGVELLLPVPMHPDRQRERGFNQSAELAREIAQITAIPCGVDQFVRQRATLQQAHLSAKQRRLNVRDAFAWQSASPPPAYVLLVDDVLTTGSTLGVCAELLKSAGAKRVDAIALARSRL